jgi:predicted O-methyltransferase YrrM
MFFAILQYIRYFFKAQSNLYIHSPFVYEFYNDILKSQNESIPAVNKLCKIYAQDETTATRADSGAGSKSKISTIASLYKIASIPKKYGFVLSKISKKYNVKNVLELGTSLGVSTAYLAHHTDKVVTIDADYIIQNIAKSNLSENKNIEFVNAKFDAALDNIIQENKPFDLIFIDGNHQEEATMEYFKIILQNIHSHTIVIFDDIYWSVGMKRAWDQIKSNKRVRISIDLYRMGIVFFDEGVKEKQDFVLFY